MTTLKLELIICFELIFVFELAGRRKRLQSLVRLQGPGRLVRLHRGQLLQVGHMRQPVDTDESRRWHL